MGFLDRFNMTIRTKLILMVGIPLIGLVGFAGNELLQQNQFSNEITTIQDFSKYATAASNLVHELQKERGATSGYIGSQGKDFLDILPKQRELTSEKLTAFNLFLEDFDLDAASPEFRANLEKARSELGRIQEVRSKAWDLKLPLPEALAYYTDINALLLSSINDTIKITPEARMTQSLTAYVNFLQAKEREGIIRAVLSNVFATGEFSGNLFERYSKLNTEYETYLAVFLSLASPEQIQFFKDRMDNESVREVARMQAIATNAGVKRSKFAPVTFNLGFGHFSHYYGLQMARPSASNYEQASQAMKHALDQVSKLEKDKTLTEQDQANLQTLKATLLNYDTALRRAGSGGRPDANISFGAANEALHQLADPEMGIDSTYWFKQMTSKINLLKEVEDRLTQDLNAQAEALNSAIVQVYIITTLAVLITLLFGVTQTRMITQLLLDLTHNLTNSSTEVAQAAQEISSSSVSMASGANEQAASIEETSASIHQLSGQSDNNAAAAHLVAEKVSDIEKSLLESLKLTDEASEIAHQAGVSAENGVQAMERILNSMKSITAGSDKINDIIEVINEITHQTKMLATNAAIEAARAGEQGKGFAVVADEVALLAENSKSSAKMISKLIRENTDNAKEGNELAKNGGVVLQEIFNNNTRLSKIMQDIQRLSKNQASRIQEITQQVESISVASKEQSQGVGQINSAIAQMESVIQTNAASAEQTASASEELSAQAAMLQSLVVELSKQMGGKVEQVEIKRNKSTKAEKPQLLSHFEQF